VVLLKSIGHIKAQLLDDLIVWLLANVLGILDLATFAFYLALYVVFEFWFHHFLFQAYIGTNDNQELVIFCLNEIDVFVMNLPFILTGAGGGIIAPASRFFSFRSCLAMSLSS